MNSLAGAAQQPLRDRGVDHEARLDPAALDVHAVAAGPLVQLVELVVVELHRRAALEARRQRRDQAAGARLEGEAGRGDVPLVVIGREASVPGPISAMSSSRKSPPLIGPSCSTFDSV